MAKDFTPHQQKIVNRYYEHQDTIRSEKLSDLVAELWLAEDPKKTDALWKRAEAALLRAGCNALDVQNAVGKRDTEALAKLVQQVDAGRAPGNAPASTAPAKPQGTPPLDGGPTVARGARSVADGRTIAQMRQEAAAAGGYDSLEEPNLKRALQAFRQKLKLARKEDESKLRGRYTTRGEASKIVAITPPHQYPAKVWEELARLGRLKKAGQGTYQLP